MVTTMGFLQYYLKSSTKRGWEMSSLLVAIHSKEKFLSELSTLENELSKFLFYIVILFKIYI